MSNLKNYINESLNRSKNNSKEHFLYNTIPVYIDPDLFFLDGKSNIRQVLDMVESISRSIITFIIGSTIPFIIAICLVIVVVFMVAIIVRIVSAVVTNANMLCCLYI